ncbi:MAG: helix-turn-helix transcriptional regulator [Spirochaetes bacterium]|nr:helix-turn-helix transcriptional regulator [Spirochaetota bacterium]
MNKKNLLIEKFGKKVKEERLKRGFSQEELAARAGVHRTYIGMIERGEKNITLFSVKKIANAFGLTIEKLIGGL